MMTLIPSGYFFISNLLNLTKHELTDTYVDIINVFADLQLGQDIFLYVRIYLLHLLFNNCVLLIILDMNLIGTVG